MTNYTNPVAFPPPGMDFSIVYGYNTITTTDTADFQFQ